MILLKIKKNFLLVFLFFFLCFSGKVEAATLFMQPAQKEVTVGNIVNVQVYVDTAGQVINSGESIIQFPQDLLEVVSLDKSSIFTLWVTEPNFSNNIGQVSFSGGVPNPGFQGSGGKITSIVFRTKKAGTASVAFLSSAVRANDGFGTDVLTAKSGAEIAIIEAPTVKPVEVEEVPSLVAMNINSSTHPDQKKWYNLNDVSLSWRLPKNATAVKTVLSASPSSNPTTYYATPITTKNLEDVQDGVWYFKANYLADGVWSKAEQYKLQMDTANPTDLSVESRESGAGKITLNIKASDSLSGIDYFRVVPDTDQPIIVESDSDGEASVDVPFSRSGEHNITVTAFDKAGNNTETVTTVTTDFVTELSIDSYPAKVRVNESIEASGTAPYPYSNLRVSLKNGDNVVEVYKIKSDSYSKFYFISRPVSSEGEYELWVDMLKENEEVSFSSEKVKILVEQPLLLQIGSYTIGLMKVLIPAAILLIIFLLIVLYGWYKFFRLYRKVKKESFEAEKISSKSFEVLRKDISGHIAKLKKVQSERKLSKEEIEFLEQFSEELDDAEDVINKEIKNITR
jgi:hypothetical protein